MVVVARSELAPTEAPYSVLFTAYGKTGEVVSASLALSSISAEDVGGLDEASLKRRLSEKRVELKRLEGDSDAKRAQLKQLQN